MNNPTIRHRNLMRHHYTQTSNVLLFGYKDLSDGAKLTYQVVDSFDWGNDAGVRKGYAYPSIVRIAAARGVNERTIQRHLAELEAADLLEREVRPRQSNVLVINEPSEKEVENYLASLAGERGDKNVTSLQPQTDGDKNVTLKKTNSPLEENKHVNEEKQVTGERSPEPLGSILERRVIQRTRQPKGTADHARREFIAQTILAALEDEHSLGYYRKVASHYPDQVIFETLGRVKELAASGSVHKSKGAVFVAFLPKAQPTTTSTNVLASLQANRGRNPEARHE
jgi:hypothetical protein